MSEAQRTRSKLNMEDMEGLVNRLLRPIHDAIKKLPTINHLDKKINNLEQQLLARIEEQDTKISTLEDRIESLEGKLVFLENSVQLQNRHVDDLEQYGRRLCLRLHGIPLVEDETASDVLNEVKDEVKRLGVKLSDGDYDRAHRIGGVKENQSGEKSQAVILRMTSWKARTAIYRSREKGKNAKTKIRFDLTKRRLELLNFANDTLKGLDMSDSFAFADINCRLGLKVGNEKIKYFNSKDELAKILPKNEEEPEESDADNLE